MRKCIVFASKTGTTQKCALRLAKNWEDVAVFDLDKEKVDLDKYDLIMIGFPIRMGKMHSSVKKFIDSNKEILKEKKVAYFVCCGLAENYMQYFEQNIAKELLDKAILTTTFGGELDIDKQKGFEKLIVKMVSKSIGKDTQVVIVEENIDSFVKKINEIY